jgi:hypothetical protein
MSRLAPILISLAFAGLAHGQTGCDTLTTYWLTDTDPATAEMYGPLLLITSVPLYQLSTLADEHETLKVLPQVQKREPYVLDVPAMFLETYKRDSIWNANGRPIKQFFGEFAENDKSAMLANGRRYKITPAESLDVIRLLKNPEGSIPLHRRHPPVGGAERTLRALRLLLEAQVEQASDDGRTKR